MTGKWNYTPWKIDILWCIFSQCSFGYSLSLQSPCQPTVSCLWRVRIFTLNLQCLYMTGRNYTQSKNPNTQMENNSQYTMFTVYQGTLLAPFMYSLIQTSQSYESGTIISPNLHIRKLKHESKERQSRSLWSCAPYLLALEFNITVTTLPSMVPRWTREWSTQEEHGRAPRAPSLNISGFLSEELYILCGPLGDSKREITGHRHINAEERHPQP